MDIEILTSEFVMIGVIDDFTSLIWHRKFYTSGLFKLKMPATDANLNLIDKGRIVHKPEANEAGVIDEYYYKREEDGGEYIEANGYFLTGLLGRRVIPTQTSFCDTYRNIMHSLVDENCVNTKFERVLQGLRLPELTEDQANKVQLQVTGKNLLSYLGKVSQVAEIGFRILYKRNYMEFDTYTGMDRSKEQTENPRVYFSQEYDNLASSEYTYSEMSKVTASYVAGEGEGIARTIVEVNNGETGFDRYESWIDSRSSREEEMTDAEYMDMLRENGLQALTAAAENFEGSVLQNGSTVYKQDFDLGDIVTVFSGRWNKELSVRVTEVEEVDDTSGSRIVVYFGKTEPTLADILNED